MRVRLLGPTEVDSGGTRLGPRDRIVLAALAARPGQACSAESLADALWPAGPPASWAKVVQGCVSRLRSLLGSDAIATTPLGYRLDPDRVSLDRDDFEALAARGRELLRAGAPEHAAAVLARALDLWRGKPFAELEEWMPARLESARLTELRLDLQEDWLEARLDAGEHQSVAVEGTVLVGEEPWRERRWHLLALAQYRSGRQAEALASIRTARRALGRELGLDPGSDLVELEQAILTQDPSLAAAHAAREASSHCPWRGLAAYDAEDAEAFFGREADVEACLDKLERGPVLALVGPSGSGKSSLMRAGLVPALRARGHEVVVLSPGVDPATAVTAARAGVPGDPVLCIDQLEEAFTAGTAAGGGAAWLADLAAYATGRAPVVLTVRSDFVSHLAADPELARLVERGLHLVAPITGTRLTEVIEKPAEVAGLVLESGLVDLLLRDAADQPGALPLLSHALAETWGRREGTVLTVAGYRASGGISGAVAASADRLRDSLSEQGLVQLRWVMLRMGGLADQGEPVRTPLPGPLAHDDPERARVLDLLVRARLVTSADGAFELAHESLVRAWPQLRAWLEEDREGQRLWRHLAASAAEWEALGRPDSELYQGVRLDAAREWAAHTENAPTTLEREFLEASVARADGERRELEIRSRADRRQNRRLRGLLAAVVAMLLVATGAALLALDQQHTAARERDTARTARGQAQQESLVARSLSLRPHKRDVAALLAVESHRQEPGALSESALMGTFTEAPGFVGYTQVPYRVVQGAVIPGTGRAVMASGTRVREVDLRTGELGPLFDHPMRSDKDLYSVVRVSADGTRVAQLMFTESGLPTCADEERLVDDDGRGCTVLTVFDRATRVPVLGPVPTPVQGGDMDLDTTGGLVAVAGGLDGDLVTYDVERRRLIGRLPGPPRPEDADNVRDTGAVRFAPGGDVWFASMQGPVRRVDPRSLEVRRSLPAPARSAHNFLALTADDGLVGAGDEWLVSWDLGTGRRRWAVDVRDDSEEWPCFGFALVPAAHRFYCGNSWGEVEERDAATGLLTGRRFDSQRGEAGDFVVADGVELVEFGRGYFSRWRVDGSGPVSRPVARSASSLAGYDPSGRHVAVTAREFEGPPGPHDVLRASDGQRVQRIRLRGWPEWVGTDTLLVRGEERSVLVDVRTGRRTPPASDEVAGAVMVFPGEDGEHGWAAVLREQAEGAEPLPPGVEEAYDVHEFESATGRLTGRRFWTPGFPYVVHHVPGQDRVWVNYYRPGGSFLSYEDELNNRGAFVDLETGEHGEELVVAASAVGRLDGEDRFVGSDYVGEIREYDADTLEPTAILPGSRGFVHGLRFTDDGRRLVAKEVERSVLVYDTATWTRLAAVPNEPFGGAPQGHLRPDGTAVLANDRSGVFEWSLEVDQLLAAACRLAGRNLSHAEWASYLGDQPYRRTCPEYPAGS